MKPLGRKYYKDKTGGKHHVNVRGKFLCWWDTLIEPKKAVERERVRKEIEEER